MKTQDGKLILCDADGCQARAFLPVGLRANVSRSGGRAAGVKGWLFVDRGHGCKHFCPSCGKVFLTGLYAGREG